MDVGMHLHFVRRWLWLLVLVPALVAVASAVHTLTTVAKTYEASVIAPLPVTAGGARDTDQFADDVKAAAETEAVLRQVADELGVESVDSDDVSVRRAGASGSYVVVAYRSKDRDLVVEVPPVIAVETVEFVLRSRIAAAEAEAEQLQSRYETLVQQAEALGATQAAEVPADAAAPSTRTAARLRALQQEQDLALTRSADATATAISLATQVDGLRASTSAQEPVAQTVAPQSLVVRRSIANAGAALVLMLCLLLAVAMLRSRRTTDKAAVASPAPGTPRDDVRPASSVGTSRAARVGEASAASAPSVGPEPSVGSSTAASPARDAAHAVGPVDSHPAPSTPPPGSARDEAASALDPRETPGRPLVSEPDAGTGWTTRSER